MRKVQVIEGSCHCGNIEVELVLARATDAYQRRACDCRFCRMHGVSYVSDPEGKLRFVVGAETTIGKYRQGAGLADFLFCSICAVLVGVYHEDASGIFGAVNVNIFRNPEVFGPEVVVSPQELGPVEKSERWKQLWFGDVQVRERAA